MEGNNIMAKVTPKTEDQVRDGMFPNLLKEEIIKLPSDANGAPDYVYMEKYMRVVESGAYNVIRCLTAVQ
jgi:hypothetical protein